MLDNLINSGICHNCADMQLMDYFPGLSLFIVLIIASRLYKYFKT